MLFAAISLVPAASAQAPGDDLPAPVEIRGVPEEPVVLAPGHETRIPLEVVVQCPVYHDPPSTENPLGLEVVHDVHVDPLNLLSAETDPPSRDLSYWKGIKNLKFPDCSYQAGKSYQMDLSLDVRPDAPAWSQATAEVKAVTDRGDEVVAEVPLVVGFDGGLGRYNDWFVEESVPREVPLGENATYVMEMVNAANGPVRIEAEAVMLNHDRRETVALGAEVFRQGEEKRLEWSFDPLDADPGLRPGDEPLVYLRLKASAHDVPEEYEHRSGLLWQDVRFRAPLEVKAAPLDFNVQELPSVPLAPVLLVVIAVAMGRRLDRRVGPS